MKERLKFWVEYQRSKVDNSVEVECSWCPVLSLKGPVGAGNLSPAPEHHRSLGHLLPPGSEQRGPDTVTCHHHHQPYTLELATNPREDFTITEKDPTRFHI